MGKEKRNKCFSDKRRVCAFVGRKSRKVNGWADEMQIDRRWGRYCGYGALATLGIVGLVAMNPVAIRGANAVCGGSENCLETSAPLAMELVAQPSISISMQPTVSMEVMPTADGEFVQSSTKVKVGTNNTSGLKILMNGLTGTDLESLNPNDTTNKVATISQPSVAADFAKNTWGYSFGEGEAGGDVVYEGIPEEAKVVKSLESAGESMEYNLAFGANVSTSLPAGTYAGEVVVSAIANPLAITSMQELIYMQDMTAEVCAATGEISVGKEFSKQLIDSRDGTKYWVTKMADQNCWMTQNLALDLREGQRLTAADTDLHGKAEWVVPTSTEFNLPEKVESVEGNIYTMRSWNLGDKYNQQHELMGNYYQFNTAAAGSGGEEAFSPSSAGTNKDDLVEAQDSICPKGWRLPAAGRNTSTGQPFEREKSFLNLVAAYGYPTTGYDTSTDHRGWTPVLTGEYQDLAGAPFNFTKPGYIYLLEGNLAHLQVVGYLWSSTLDANSKVAFDFALFENRVSPAYSDMKIYGLSVRCVAR